MTASVIHSNLDWTIARHHQPDKSPYDVAGGLSRSIGRGRDEVPFGAEGYLGACLAIGQLERDVEWCRAQVARSRDTHGITRACLVLALTMAGCGEEPRAAAADGLIDAAEAARNPVDTFVWHSSPTASPALTPIRSTRLKPCAGALHRIVHNPS